LERAKGNMEVSKPFRHPRHKNLAYTSANHFLARRCPEQSTPHPPSSTHGPASFLRPSTTKGLS
jgi:hypothetical protein